MTDQQFYDLSTKTNDILLQAKKVLGLHLLRYKHIVDHSDRGSDCVYSKMTKRHCLENLEEECRVIRELVVLAKEVHERLGEALDEVEDSE